MARDIPAGTDTTATVEAEDFVRGVLERRGDHDWYRVELDPGRYVFRLSGARRRSGRRSLFSSCATRTAPRSSGTTTTTSPSRASSSRSPAVARPASSTSAAKAPTRSRRNSDGVAGRRVGHATGDFTLSVNRLDGSPVDAIAGAQWLEDRASSTSSSCRTGEPARSSMAAAPSHPPAGPPTRSERRWRPSTPFPRSATSASDRPDQRRQADFKLLTYDKPTNYLGSSSRPEPSAKAPAFASIREATSGAMGYPAERGSRTRGLGLGAHAARVRPRARARAPA